MTSQSPFELHLIPVFRLVSPLAASGDETARLHPPPFPSVEDVAPTRRTITSTVGGPRLVGINGTLLGFSFKRSTAGAAPTNSFLFLRGDTGLLHQVTRSEVGRFIFADESTVRRAKASVGAEISSWGTEAHDKVDPVWRHYIGTLGGKLPGAFPTPCGYIHMGDNPATVGYWDRWYDEGPGVKRYEWYNLTSEDLSPVLEKYLSSDVKILQVGVGNSRILEEVIESSHHTDIALDNIDISQTAIDQMIEIQQKYEMESNKKKIDALLSHGTEETGEDEKILRLFEEAYRVLRPGGAMMMISGNDVSVLNPYLYSQDWEGRGVVDFGGLNLQFYRMTKHVLVRESYDICIGFYGVVVSTSGFDPGIPGSNPGRT
ncbi:hypothetical protein PROFUN_12990 [Planoprotostelium fungivorum]|uniref:Methyltransferase type 11 domain-containing protein n=1 Tax=Planoprotostelium fungivorum TaxID=1890364 RepID=A0A2P6N606_9EUKA|nr:hypothetical protein PROFUN_12990 [Planoprotostelium fungivorum]